jgi:hypothetical protein
MRRALPVAALVLALGAVALPSAAQAARGRLVLRSISTARSAAVGGSVRVDVRVAHTGRSRGARVGFHLSADRRRDAHDVHLAGDARLRASRIVARPRIPATQPLGTYHLIGCVRDRCRASRERLQVTARPVGTRELVAAAVAAHRLTPQQGLVYRVYAALGDPRLPAAYRGDDAQPEELVMREVVEQWRTLSAAQQRAVLPFFTPPAAKRGRRAVAAGVRPIPLVEPACDTNQAVGNHWRTIAKPGGHVRIWWLNDRERQVGPRARSLLTDIENHMWPRLVAIFGREPLRDGSERCFHGIDDKLDIYMWGLPRGRAMTFAYPPDCANSPAYIVFDARASLPRRWEVAHELTHAFQFSYDYAGACSGYNDWDEATATWAAAWLYPGDDEEHPFRWLMRDPDESLADADYDGWVFPYAMAQLHGAGTIASIYAQTERRPDVLHAIDAGLPGGLARAWPEFAMTAWNQDPVEPNFAQWDDFAQRPEESGSEIGTQQVDIGPSGQTELDVPLGLGPLTRAYRHVRFGPSVTQITVDKPSFPGVNVQAIVKLRDGTTRIEDWSRQQRVFCPQDPGQRPQELLLVVSNTSLTQPSPAGVNSGLRLVATNIGCSRYRGSVSGTGNVHGGDTNIDESWTANGLVYDRYLDENQVVPRFLFRLTAGSVTWSLSGTQYGCTMKAGPVTLPVRANGTGGQLETQSFVAHSGAPRVVRKYFATGYGLPAVPGTVTCRSGTSTRYFTPHAFLQTLPDLTSERTIPGDGVLQGAYAEDDGNGTTATYRWRLAPDR